jgi:hypothetical protein
VRLVWVKVSIGPNGDRGMDIRGPLGQCCAGTLREFKNRAEGSEQPPQQRKRQSRQQRCTAEGMSVMRLAGLRAEFYCQQCQVWSAIRVTSDIMECSGRSSSSARLGLENGR